jgi:hypothetical protein
MFLRTRSDANLSDRHKISSMLRTQLVELSRKLFCRRHIHGIQISQAIIVKVSLTSHRLSVSLRPDLVLSGFSFLQVFHEPEFRPDTSGLLSHSIHRLDLLVRLFAQDSAFCYHVFPYLGILFWCFTQHRFVIPQSFFVAK